MTRLADPPARREVAIAVGLGALGTLLLLAAGLAMLGGTGTAYDLAAYLAAAERVVAGGTPYQPETLGGPFRPGPADLYLYAPALAVLLGPLAVLPEASSTVLWLGVRIGLLALGCAVMPVRPWVRGATLLVAALSYPVLLDLNLGNVSVVVLALTAIAWRWLDRPAGGIALGLGLLVRPTLVAVLLWQALRRRWRPIGWALGTVLVAVLATLPIVGLTGWLDYATVLRNVSDVLGVPRNVDLGSAARLVGLGEPWSTLAWLLGAAVGLGIIVAAARRDASTGYVAVASASLLLAPLLWAHYLSSLLLPAALLADRGRRWGLLLPLLGWLPEPLLPFAALAGALVPFLVARPSEGGAHAGRDPGERAGDRTVEPS